MYIFIIQGTHSFSISFLIILKMNLTLIKLIKTTLQRQNLSHNDWRNPSPSPSCFSPAKDRRICYRFVKEGRRRLILYKGQTRMVETHSMKSSQELCREPKFIFSFLIAVSSSRVKISSPTKHPIEVMRELKLAIFFGTKL
jgi:hypothetical protein